MMKIKTIFTVFLSISLLSCSKNEPSNDLKIWYDHPASEWNEALPVGNGRLGAMVFGDPASEHLQLNEETLWAGGPHNNINPAVAPYLGKVRELIFKGKYEESHSVANENIKADQNGMPYQTMGDIFIDFPGIDAYDEYYRELDISSAVAQTKFSANGVTYKRELFSSFTDQVMILRLTADKKGAISCNARLSSPQSHSIQIRNNQLYMRGVSTDHEGIKGQVEFTSILAPFVKNGEITAKDSILKIVNADEVIFYLSAGTNFKNYHDLSNDPDEIAEDFLAKARIREYKDAIGSHTEYYKSFFDRVKLDLGSTDSVNKPTDVRIAEFRFANDPQMAELYFQFGRYLLISSSQPGGQPANLQGIWNDMLTPPWESKYTVNINCEMNYWPAEVTNLSELHSPLFEMIRDLSVTGQEGARKIYDARGWVVHHNTDIWRSTGIYDRATYGMWQSGSNWLTQHLWQHFLFTGDTAFLESFYPVIKSAAEFYVDELVEEPHTGYLVICPSNSPENKYMNIASSSAGTTMDNQLLNDLFSNVIEASGIFNTDKKFADTLKYLKSRLAPMQIGKHNQLQEWLYDWDDPNDKHRHVSHLYGLYPSNQVSPFSNPVLTNAAKQSLIYRGDESTGWSMGWKVNLWARLLDGDHALKLMRDQIQPAKRPNGEVHGGTYPNLLDAHPPFQIDGNFGCTSGIAEMLVQSQDGFVFILPALPSDWPRGSVSGLKTRGGFEVNITWNNGAVDEVNITSTLGGNLRIRSWNELQMAQGDDLPIAEGENTNSFFHVNPIKPPLVSPEADPKPIELPESFLYDIPTEKGGVYRLKLKSL